MYLLKEEEIKKSLTKINKKKYFEDWFNIVKPILLTKEFQVRRMFSHHKESVWDHSIDVSYKSYVLAHAFRCSTYKASIGGLLHDFYPHCWRYSKRLEQYDSSYLDGLYDKKKFFKKHGFVHAKEASINYLKYFKEYEDEIVTDCIEKHMFPLNIRLPKYKESWIVTISDKIDSILDIPIILFYLIKKG